MKHRIIAALLTVVLLAGCSQTGTLPGTSDTSSVPSVPASSLSDPSGSVPPSSDVLPPPSSAVKQPVLPAGVRFLSEDAYDYVAPFVNGFAFAEKGDQWGYVDKSGRFVVTADTVGEGISCNDTLVNLDYLRNVDGNPFPASPEGIAPFYKDGKWGLVALATGAVVKDAQLTCPAILRESRAVAVAGDKVDILKPDGSVAFSAKKSAQPYYVSGRLIVKLADDKDGVLSVVDPDGNRKFTIAEYGTGGKADIYGTTPFASDNLNLTGTDAGNPVYWGRFDGGTFEFVDADGKMPFKTSDVNVSASSFHCNRVFMQNKSKLSALFDQTGKQLTDYIFSGYLNFRTPEHTLVRQEGIGLILIDSGGNRLGTEAFDTLIAPPQPSYIIVGKGGKVGVINPRGEVVTPFIYDDILLAANGMSWVKSNESYTLLGADGVPVGFPSAAEASWLGDGCYAVNVGSKLRIMTVQG